MPEFIARFRFERPGSCSRQINKGNADLIHGASRWYPSLPVLRRTLAGAAAILIAAWGYGGEAPIIIGVAE